jgi:hypothetical protein
MDDHELEAAAAKRGWTLSRFKLADGYRYFVKDIAGNVLFDGKSFDRRELAGALQGERHET